MPEWPHGITLNALISVLSTGMKATMGFILTECLAQLKWSWFRGGNSLSDLALLDAASRGAAGAFIVLFSFLASGSRSIHSTDICELLTYYSHLVTFGCFILVLQ